MFSRAERQFLWISFRFFWLASFKAEVGLSPIYHTHTHTEGPVTMAADCMVVGGITVILKTHISFIVNKWACIQRHGLTFGMSWRLQVAHFLCLIFLQVFILHGKKNKGCTLVTWAKKLNEHISPASQLLFESDLISSSSFSGWVNWRAVGWTHVQPSCLQGSGYNFDGPLKNQWKKKNELKLSRTNIFFF